MRSRFVIGPHDPSDNFLDPGWAEIDGNFSSAAGLNGWNPSASAPVKILVNALTNEAIQAESAQTGGTPTVVAATSGGITINLLFDSAAMAAPASFRAGIQQAASILTGAISDKITVNIQIDYSGIGGGAAAGPDNGQYESYSSVRADLINNATPGDTVFNTLPGGSSFQGQSNVAVWNAQLKLFGLLGANDTSTDDGSATFATDINSNLLVGVALHELTHAMGRVPYGPVPGQPQAEGPEPDIFDFFRFTSPGSRLVEGGGTAPAAYFSVDGGYTKLADYGQTSDASDFLNSGVQGYNDPFNEYYTGSTSQTLTTADKEQLDALGFHTAPQGIVVAATTSQAIQGGVAVTLLSGQPTITDLASASLSSATIKIANSGGSAVAGDELYINGLQSGTVDGGLVTVSWNNVTKSLSLVGNISIAAYETLLSEITYQDTGTDSSSGSHPLRTVTWTVNDGTSNLSTTSQIAIDRAPMVMAANVALNANLTTVAASLLFTASDPDGDAIAGYALKDTGNGHFVLNGVVQANNQEIDVTAAQLTQLTYQTAGGTDSLQVRVNDGTLWSSWQSFSVTGPTATVIEAFGSTSLVEVGSNFYLNSISSGFEPELKYGGAAIVAGQFGSWTLIGAEIMASGYEVAWKLPGTDQYSVWFTDNSGNETSSTGAISGISNTLESLETSFHQDLNGDGTIGPVATTIESFGSTSLVELGGNFYMNSISNGSGPELKYGGAAVVAGHFGSWTPIGAEITSSGYEVAWKLPGTDQYSMWFTDNSGNETSSTGAISGTSTTLESLETSFHQDLNGDGIIGLVASTMTVIESFGSTSLVEVGGNFYMNSISSGSGPELKYGGAAVVAGQFGSWTPIGAEITASGYEVAWKLPGTDQYSVWFTDNSGNETSSTGAISGTSTALESLETSFHQDLNGDGTIGPVATTIEAFGSTSPVELGGNFYMNSVSSGSGPELKYGGAAVVAGQFGSWTPIGAEIIASGYEVAWKVPGTDQYSVWFTGNSGNETSSTGAISGTSTTLESLEPSFHQDLNGDGTIGLVASAKPLAGTAASVIAAGATLELTAGDTGAVTFSSTTGKLILDDASTFSGQITGFAGDGTLAGSDQIDLRGINYGQVHSDYGSSTGVLDVSNGTTTVDLKFAGTYSQANFKFADDGSVGTIVYDPPTSSQTSASGGTSNNGQIAGGSPSNAPLTAGHDIFVFAPNFGQVAVADFNPAADTIQFSRAVFANLNAVLASVHDDGHGNAVIADAARDTITIQHVTVAQLLAHQGDFHFV
jgi:hypothetical protein